MSLYIILVVQPKLHRLPFTKHYQPAYVIMVMVWVCSGPRRMRIERKREEERKEEDCGIISHS